jgi:hypothetical protein
VRLADGSLVTVEELQNGMMLRADNSAGAARIAQVLRLTSTDLRQLLVRPLGSTEAPYALSLNGEHRVWNARTGWTPTMNLKPGDWLRGENDTLLEVVANAHVPGQHEVVSFHLEGEKAAYVGGVLVEDICEPDYLKGLKSRTVLPVATEVTP